MHVFILKRIMVMGVTVLVSSMVVFALLEVSPGSVATKVLGPYSSTEQRQLWLEENGYTRPAYVRYFSWLGNILQGDFGESTRFKVPVHDVLWPRLLNTAILGALVMMVVIPVSLTIGVLAGMRAGSLWDRCFSLFSILTTSLPEFTTSVLLSALFVFTLGWLPGTSTMLSGFSWKEMVLPVLVLSLFDIGYVARITRASMADVMNRPFIRTAMLKGLPYPRVIVRHALHNALIAPFTIIMLQINWLLSGVIVVEFFFAYKGFGSLLLEASLNQDLYVIEACTLISILVALTTQTLSDIGYVYINPRIRFS